MATPSPVATAGFVVSRNTRPAPPVASRTARAVDTRDAAVVAQQFDAGNRPPSTHERVASAWSNTCSDRDRADPRPERSRDLAAGRIPRVQHAAHRVRAFASQGGPAVGITIERDAPIQQLPDIAGSLGDHDIHRVGIAEPGARIERVGHVQRRGVVRAHRRGNAALRVAGVALGAAGFGEEQHLSASDEIGRGAKARNPAADDHVVGANVHPVLS